MMHCTCQYVVNYSNNILSVSVCQSRETYQMELC